MKGQQILTSVLVLVLSLTLTVGLSQAEGPTPSPYQGEGQVGVGISSLAPLGTGFTYQGQLIQSGNPVNSTCDFQFSLWDTTTGGAQIGTTQTKSGVSVTSGLFTIPDLDFGSGAFTGDARYLQIGVRCPAGSGSYTTLSGRVSLTATPYAHSLRPGASVESATGNALNLSTSATSGAALNAIASASSGNAAAVYGSSSSPGGAGLSGYNSSSGYGVYGNATGSSGTPYGVYGLASHAGSATSYGVYGKSNSNVGTGVGGEAPRNGVYGKATASNGYGVYGEATASSGTTYGVYGKASSTDGKGVYGEGHTGVHGYSTNGVGVWGASPDGWGVSGSSTNNYGVRGGSTNGTGVYGTAPTTGTIGVATASGGKGVYGEATASSGTTYGVYGKTNSPDGYGVYAQNIASGGAYDEPTAIYGEVNAVGGFAVMGVNNSGHGVYGEGHGQYGVGGFSYGSFGVFGKGLDGGIGVVGEGATTGTKGIANANSGETYGVHGVTSSPDGSGVYGVGGQYGVYGYNINGTGVYGRSFGGTVDTGIGVKGVGTTAGVYGQTGWENAAGGRFKNMWTGYEKADAVGVWAGSYYGDIIQGHELDGDGFSMDQVFRVTRPGDVYIDGTYYDTGADFAEMLPAGEGLEPGDVLVIGPDGQLARSTTAYASAVVGVYSTKPAFVGGSDEEMANTGKVPLAIVGIVPVKASTENGAIAPGDLLVASSTTAHAMKAGSNPPSGTIIGKALEGLDSGTGVIQMLVTLQ